MYYWSRLQGTERYYGLLRTGIFKVTSFGREAGSVSDCDGGGRGRSDCSSAVLSQKVMYSSVRGTGILKATSAEKGRITMKR